MSPPGNTRSSRGGGSKGVSRKRLVRRARELVREATTLVRKKGTRAGSAAVETVRGDLDAVRDALPARGRRDADLERLATATEALDRSLEEHFGSWRKTMLREYVEAIAWAVGLALLIRSFFFEAFSIPSGSMLPTLHIGDRLFVNKIAFGLYVPFSSHRMVHWDEPDRGDVIVFEFDHAGAHKGEDYIKRVIGLPGDRVRLEDNRLWINGEPVPTEVLGEARCAVYDSGRDEAGAAVAECPCVRQEETVDGTTYTTQHMLTPPGGGVFGRARCVNQPDWPLRDSHGRYIGDAGANEAWPDVVVPEDHVLVMGDNRDRSEDGRFWGFVDFDDIKGNAFVIWWARDTSRLFTWLD
ncbi:MAG: signal peptidase I [Myxococcota bacterium]